MTQGQNVTGERLRLTSCLQRNSGFKVFSSDSYGGGAVLFSNSSTAFLKAEYENPREWMGKAYYHALQAMDCKREG